jgi:hypothetical protein
MRSCITSRTRFQRLLSNRRWNLPVSETALLSQEGSTTNGRARGGSKAETLRFWNHPSHDLDCVSIMLPS